jgi:hypothetical protein
LRLYIAANCLDVETGLFQCILSRGQGCLTTCTASLVLQDACAAYCIAIAHLINHSKDAAGAIAAAKAWLEQEAAAEPLAWLMVRPHLGLLLINVYEGCAFFILLPFMAGKMFLQTLQHCVFDVTGSTLATHRAIIAMAYHGLWCKSLLLVNQVYRFAFQPLIMIHK